MGDYVIKMPDIGEGIAEAELVEWLVEVGEEIATDAPLAEVMTDKARVQIPSPVAGTILRLGAEPGEFVAVGGELIRLIVAGRGNVSEAEPRPRVEPEKPPQRLSPSEPDTPGRRLSLSTSQGAHAKVLAAPAVRAQAREAGVDLAKVVGTGPEQRVTAADLAAYLGHPASSMGTGADAVEEIAVTGIRRITARRLQEAWTRIPHITIVEEVDVTELESLRTKLNDQGTDPRLTVLPFLIRAIVRGVGEQPELNAHFDDEAETIRRYAAVHVGIATQAPDGLKVPVLRHAEALELWQSATRIEEVTAAGRDVRASREELTGSTITLTSLGKLGAIASTPIINRPEVAIVGVNRMAVRPLWNGSSFVPRTVMNLSCSFDHRVIDGWAAATFVARLKESLETPALLFVPS